MYDVNIFLNKLNNICVKNCSVFVANDELGMPNRQSEEFEDTKGVIRIRISKINIMAKRKSTKGQKTIYKTYT